MVRKPVNSKTRGKLLTSLVCAIATAAVLLAFGCMERPTYEDYPPPCEIDCPPPAEPAGPQGTPKDSTDAS